jgi:hypothetical protein
VVHIQNGTLLSIKKEGNPVFDKNVDDTGGHYAK